MTLQIFMVKIPKVGSNYPFLAVILNDFVLKKEEEFYPQVFLKECNYVEKEKKQLDILLKT